MIMPPPASTPIRAFAVPSRNDLSSLSLPPVDAAIPDFYGLARPAQQDSLIGPALIPIARLLPLFVRFGSLPHPMGDPMGEPIVASCAFFGARWGELRLICRELGGRG